jgi:4-amino-4-deoxy-L-arabinose transferase-like glycosyltransferase
MTSTSSETAEPTAPGSVRLTRLDAVLIVLVLGLTIFFRFWQQGQIPPGMDFDEAFESLEAHRLITEPGYHPIFFYANNGVPPVKIYLTALAFLVAGESSLSIRYVSGIVGTLTVLAVYLLVRALFPLSTARDDGEAPETGASQVARRFMPFAACLLLAVLPWHVAFSRHGIEVILLPLWATLAVLFLWLGLRHPRGWGYFVLSGLFWGSVFYTYQAGALLPGVLILFVAYKTLQEPGFLRRCGKPLLILGAVALLTLLPLAQVARAHPEVLTVRAEQTTIFAHGQGSETPLRTLARNTVAVAGLFVFGGDISKTDNIPLRPPIPLVLALVLFVGVGVALRRIKRAEYGLLLIWFVWMLFPSILTENAPSIRRAIGAVPPMVILMALGLGWLSDGIRRQARGRRTWRTPVTTATGVAIGALLAGMVLWGYRYYFVEWASGKDLFHYFDVGLVDTGNYAAASPADARLYYTPAWQGDMVFLPLKWPIRDREVRTFDGRYGLVMAPAGPEPSLYMITSFLGDTRSLSTLQEVYPTGQVAHEVRNRYGVIHSTVFAVEPETAPAPAIQDRMSADFENQIELLGSNLSSTVLRGGETVTVTLFWRSLSGPTPLEETVFTHLVGPQDSTKGTVRAGHDGPPLNNSYPTTRWSQGEIVADEHPIVVPADAPRGAYQIETGLYAAQQGGTRLRVVDSTGATVADSVAVGAVSIR